VLGSLSFAPGLAVAGLTTSVSFAAAMGGAQTLAPAVAERPPAIVVSMALPAATIAPSTAEALATAAAPTGTPAPPTATPTPAPTETPVAGTPATVAPTSKPPAAHAPVQPVPPPAAPAAPKPTAAPVSTCQQQFLSKYPQYPQYAQWYCTTIYPQYGFNWYPSAGSASFGGEGSGHGGGSHLAWPSATTSTGADHGR
jgi:hypothetical protein